MAVVGIAKACGSALAVVVHNALDCSFVHALAGASRV